MTIEQAREEVPTIDYFLAMSCGMCTGNDAYCPNYCDDLIKAQQLPFDKIISAYARYDGDMRYVMRYIRHAK